MKMKLLKEWAGNKIGTVVEVGGGVADIWIRRGFAETVADAPQASDKMLRHDKPKRTRKHQVRGK